MVNPPNNDPWQGWSWEESESEEEISPEEILNQRVVEILQASLINKGQKLDGQS